MCRAMMYLGEPVQLDDLLFKPDSSLVNQAYMPKMLHMLNLAGFGMMAWDSSSFVPEQPHRYRSPSLPVFDGNLKSLAVKTRAECVIAHVRGVAYSTTVKVSEQNTHPFHFAGAAVAMAHNGDIYRIGEMKGTLMPDIDPALLAEMVEVAQRIAKDHSDGDFRLVFNTGANAGQTVFHVHAHVLSGGLAEGSL